MNGKRGHWGKTVRGTWKWVRKDGCSPADAARCHREYRAEVAHDLTERLQMNAGGERKWWLAEKVAVCAAE